MICNRNSETFFSFSPPMVKKPSDLNQLNGWNGTNNKICRFSEIGCVDDNNFNCLICG